MSGPARFDNPCIDTGDTTWILISTAFVLTMFGGLGFFQAGLLRAKNAQSMLMQILSGSIVIGVMWDAFGYSLVFGKSLGGVIGDLSHVFLLGVDYNNCSQHAPKIPSALFALFMMMFAVIAPLLITGSIAERMIWKSYMAFIILWEAFVYYPIAHWIWGKGWLHRYGVLDFAGGLVIHASAGVSALIMAVFLGRRDKFFKYRGEFPPSNIPLSMIGTCMLWGGWFGFNSGSALTGGALATSALASTQLAAMWSGFVWLIISCIRNKPTLVAVMSGIIAGLAGITPASGYIGNLSSIVFSIVGGAVSYFSVWVIKEKLHIDDALDVASVHGIPGILGSLAIGICSRKSLNPNGVDGWIAGGGTQLLQKQMVGVAVVVAYAAFVTLLIALLLRKTIGLKVSPEEEELGLDMSLHGECAYILCPDMKSSTPREDLSENSQLLP